MKESFKKLELAFLEKWGGMFAGSPQTFYNNLLKLNRRRNGIELHQRILVVQSAYGTLTAMIQSVINLMAGNSNISTRKQVVKESLQEVFNFLKRYEDYFSLGEGFTKAKMQKLYEAIDLYAVFSHDFNHSDTRRKMDYMLAMGEIISLEFTCAILKSRNIPHLFLPAECYFQTDDSYGMAWPNLPAIESNLSRIFEEHEGEIPSLIITAGYIGVHIPSSELNLYRTTTLGKEGSDFTAVVLGSLFEISVDFFKNVSGILDVNNDKKIINIINPLQLRTICERNNGKPLSVRACNFMIQHNVKAKLSSFDDVYGTGTVIDPQFEPQEVHA